MKRTLLFLLFCLLISPQKVAAAELGLPSFVSLNNILIGRETSFNFFLPQPLDPTKQYQQQPLTFAVETEELASVIPVDILTRATYTWQFGDGTKGEGREITHSYSKPGSYRISVRVSVPVDVIETPTNYTQSWTLTVLPGKNVIPDVIGDPKITEIDSRFRGNDMIYITKLLQNF